MLAERAREVALEATVRERLELIESALLRAAEADSPMVTEAAQHVIAAGGKRFRPLLVVLASQFGPTDAGEAPIDDVVRAAMVVELTHVASLYHDDVMDEARLRRGSASANARWGNTVAILVGDFLFARASEEVAELGPDYVRLQSRTFARLVQGQIAETVGPQDADPLEHYLSVVADKTASLIATSALFGAKVAGAVPCSERWRRTRRRSAWSSSSPTTSSTSPPTRPGRRREPTCGKASRPCDPVVPRSADPTSAVDARLLQLLDSDLREDTDLAEALVLLRAHRCVDQARAEVQRRADRARSFLIDLPAGPARDALADLCDTVVTRAV